jgi:hypothetical protein
MTTYPLAAKVRSSSYSSSGLPERVAARFEEELAGRGTSIKVTAVPARDAGTTQLRERKRSHWGAKPSAMNMRVFAALCRTGLIAS